MSKAEARLTIGAVGVRYPLGLSSLVSDCFFSVPPHCYLYSCLYNPLRVDPVHQLAKLLLKSTRIEVVNLDTLKRALYRTLTDPSRPLEVNSELCLKADQPYSKLSDSEKIKSGSIG